MKIFFVILTAGILASGIDLFMSHAPSALESEPAAASVKKKHLSSFASEADLNSFFKKLRKEKRAVASGGGGGGVEINGASSSSMTVDVSAGSLVNAESVTNVQHAGVDEGGIVKLHGNCLVILRRGRLFTVSIENSSLRPVSSIDAFGPGINPQQSWYDEMLISENTIAVIGFSYERGGTEVGIFNIDDRGNLKYRSTYHLRSNDYYSSRNYASRLIGQKLIFYSPLYLPLDKEEIADSLPALRRWRNGVKTSDFKRIAPATRIYRGQKDFDANDGLTLHTVTVCDLGGGEMACEATSVLGPGGNVFYVSPQSVYVWSSEWWNASSRPMLYRLPLDGSAPSALEVSGSPVDQFSFLESEDGYLNVVVRSESKGDAMWSAEASEGDVALMRIQLSSFSDGRSAVPASEYRTLPKPLGYTFQNRFVGKYILYGAGSGWDVRETPDKSSVYVAQWDGNGGISAIPLLHGVDRIESLGPNSIVIGTSGRDLHFTTIRLDADPAVAGSHVFEGGSQGELRSHGFFYKADGDDSGILGLPVRGPGRHGYEHLFEDSASILFLKNGSLRLTQIGELKSRAEGAVDDGCKASCVDWYGNARPLFIDRRIFALLGYEIVEGKLDGGDIKEVSRTSFAPVRRGPTTN